MDKIKIKRVKRKKKEITTAEKILAGAGLGGALLGMGGAVTTKNPSDQFVRTQDSQTAGKTEKIRANLQKIFGPNVAKAAEDGVIYADSIEAVSDDAEGGQTGQGGAETKEDSTAGQTQVLINPINEQNSDVNPANLLRPGNGLFTTNAAGDAQNKDNEEVENPEEDSNANNQEQEVENNEEDLNENEEENPEEESSEEGEVEKGEDDSDLSPDENEQENNEDDNLGGEQIKDSVVDISDTADTGSGQNGQPRGGGSNIRTFGQNQNGAIRTSAVLGSNSQNADTYVVQKGDSLWKISQRFYGDGTRWREILAANPGCLAEAENTKTLKIGYTLNIPN